MSKTTENVIVIIIMVAIVIGLLYFVGYDNIKAWLSTPFVWKEPDFLSVAYAGTTIGKNSELVLFEVYNRSDAQIKSYTFQILAGERTIKVDSWNSYVFRDGYTDGIEPNGFTTIALRCNSWELPDDTYEFFNNLFTNA